MRSIHCVTAQQGLVNPVVHRRCVVLFGIGTCSGPGLGIEELITIP